MRLSASIVRSDRDRARDRDATRFDGRTDVKSWDKNILDASTARVGGRVGRVGACTRSRDRREVVTRGGGAFGFGSRPTDDDDDDVTR